MTDKINGLFVFLESDMRTDDAEETIKAIGQIKGVMKVETHLANPFSEACAVQRFKTDAWKKLQELFWNR